MPEFHWNGKRSTTPQPADLILDAVIHPNGAGYPKAGANDHLILGDNTAIMAGLLPRYEGRINLIYADPPFFTNKKFNARIGHGEDSRKPSAWKLAEGYADHWDDLDSYLEFLYQRLLLMYRLLAPNGTLYLHLDWHADAYARLILDEIFGADKFINEIIWTYHGPSPIRRAFNRKHDTILMYAKSADYIFNVDDIREPYNPNTVKTFNSAKAGFGKIPDLARGKVPEDWWYFPVVARLHNERTGYPTQKPEVLLERIIRASSKPGDIVADFFSGSGTTAVVAAKLDRHFIATDTSPRAIQTAISRLIGSSKHSFDLSVTDRSALAWKTPKSRIKINERSISIPPSLTSTLRYLEIDPDYDGEIFHSAQQVVRGLRDNKFLREIELTVKRTGNVCIRMVTDKGEQFQMK